MNNFSSCPTRVTYAAQKELFGLHTKLKTCKQIVSKKDRKKAVNPRTRYAIEFRNFLRLFFAQKGLDVEKYDEEIWEYCQSLTVMPFAYLVRFVLKIIKNENLAESVANNIVIRIENPNRGVKAYERYESNKQEQTFKLAA